MKPYYADDWVSLYHGDCREVIPGIAADALVTDPPYGVGLGSTTGRSGAKHGLVREAYASFDDSYESYLANVVPVIAACVAITKRGGVFTGPHIQELPKATAIGGVYCAAGAGRHSWGFKTFLPVLLYGTDPTLNKGARANVLTSSTTAEKNGHPCPKPLPWMRWLVGLVSLPGEVVLDPFAGSGTTLRACKDMERRCIGIEIEERYCEVAAKRLAQDVLDFEEDSCGV